MRAAFLTREFPPEVYGGAGAYAEHLTRALGRLVDLEVHCFGAPRAAEGVLAYQPWEALAGTGQHLAALQAMSADLAMAAGLDQVDVVHSNTWYTNLAGHLARLLYGVPHVVTAHSLEPLRAWKAEQLGGGYAVSSFCEQAALAEADMIIAVSSQMRRDVLRCYPSLPPERVIVVHNGIDTSEYTPAASTGALRRLGIDPGAPLVVFVGRITRQKGIVHLLQAARELRPEAQLALCAASPDTPDIAREVNRLTRELQAARGGVFWVDEMLERAEVVELMSHAVAVVCPSVYEPFGLVNVEAMACGTAVVATRTGGIPEIVVDGVTGLLVDPGPTDPTTGEPRNPDAFAASLAGALNRLLDDPSRAARMGAAGRRRVTAHFTWDAAAARTEAIYRKVLRNRRAAPGGPARRSSR